MNGEYSQKVTEATKHTPGKAIVGIATCDGVQHLIVDLPSIPRCLCSVTPMSKKDAHDEANAKRIALCWNSHDELVKLAEELIEAVDAECAPVSDFSDRLTKLKGQPCQ